MTNNEFNKLHPVIDNSQYNQYQNKSKTDNSKSDKIYDIRERTLQFAIRIMEIARDIPTTIIYSSIRSQLVKSGTSIGANLAEGDGAKTKRDFINKLVIARKEAKETKYWLRLTNGLNIKKLNLDEDIQEIQEIINIIS